MIPFSRKEFAILEALVYIALHHSVQPISGKKLADVQQLSTRYLEQMMQKLVHAKLLRSIRGPRGGYLLARERRKVSIGEIIALLHDGDEEHTIHASTALASKVILPFAERAGVALEEALHNTTLADLCEEAYKHQATNIKTNQPAERTGRSDFII
jgi:Rrf2 family protein